MHPARASLCVIDYYDANQATPTVALLQTYNAILVYADLNNGTSGGAFTDAVGVGTAVASYFEGGGRVVVALFADAG
jgi:hypothetical protein